MNIFDNFDEDPVEWDHSVLAVSQSFESIIDLHHHKFEAVAHKKAYPNCTMYIYPAWEQYKGHTSKGFNATVRIYDTLHRYISMRVIFVRISYKLLAFIVTASGETEIIRITDSMQLYNIMVSKGYFNE